MESIRKIKKRLKKIYAESLLKGTLPTQYCEIKAHLFFHRNSWRYDSNSTRIRPHSIEITYFYYDAYNNEYDWWDISKGLVSKNKAISTNEKIKYNKLKFKYFDC